MMVGFQNSLASGFVAPAGISDTFWMILGTRMWPVYRLPCLGHLNRVSKCGLSIGCESNKAPVLFDDFPPVL